MFKLIKIIGSRTNVPEITSFDIDGETPYKAGSLYFVNDNTVSIEELQAYNPRFIPIETIPENSGKTAVHGYIVTPEMVFETEVCNALEGVAVGDTLAPCIDGIEGIDHLEGAEGDMALLLCKDNVETTKKVLVALRW